MSVFRTRFALDFGAGAVQDVRQWEKRGDELRTVGILCHVESPQDHDGLLSEIPTGCFIGRVPRMFQSEKQKHYE